MTHTDLSDDYLALNAMLNIYDADGQIQFDKDKEAAHSYFLHHVNQNTVFFHDLAEKLDYLVEEGYYAKEFLAAYDFAFIKSLFRRAYSYKFRFSTFVSAHKFYSSYALRTFDGTRYLERYEDRIAVTALYLARGQIGLAERLVDEMIAGRYQPATPTFQNAGRAAGGDLVSCFLLRVEDNTESLMRAAQHGAQLSKRGGGVAYCFTNVRAKGDPLKNMKGKAKGVLPFLKIIEDTFHSFDQLGQRPGAAAAYISVHHPDIIDVLDSRRENASEEERLNDLSIGVVIPDITYALAARDKDLYAFSPYDVQKVYGVGLGDISITEKYEEMMDDDRIRKTKIMPARELFSLIAATQFESGYPYILNEDTANRDNQVGGRIQMSNLCSEILQPSTPSEYHEDGTYRHIGEDISCNLGSLNIAKVMEGGNVGNTIITAIEALSSVAEMTQMDCAPSVRRGNDHAHSVGLGQMNLHGYLASVGIHYGSPAALDFVNVYGALVRYWALTASNQLAEQYDEVFDGFWESAYATGEFWAKYTDQNYLPRTPEVAALFEGIWLPLPRDWDDLAGQVADSGLYNRHLLAIPPTGSISYVNNSTSSIHPITSKIEIREEKALGRVYYPAFGMTNENLEYYTDAYELGWKPLIDTYAVMQQHVDQGLSMTLFMKETDTREFNRAQMYAWQKGIKTIYYVRLQQDALEGTDTAGCVSCAL